MAQWPTVRWTPSLTQTMLKLLFWAFAILSVVVKSAELRVSSGESIQAAVDAAVPGDTIIVEAGTYQEDTNDLYGLHVTTDNVTLIGEGEVRLLATGSQQTGVFAAPPGCGYTDRSCESPDLQKFAIRGFSVENFPKNGIQTRWVDGFNMIGCASIDNLNNGLYPTLSKNGVVSSSYSSGSLDSALWVAGSQNVTVVGNELTQAPTGLEITVSDRVYCRNNAIHDNTVGVGLYHANMAGNPPKGDMKNWIIENNTIHNNNFVNTAPEGSFQAALLPGFGVFLVGVSDHTIRMNEIRNNSAVGILVAGYCTAVSLSPLPDCEEEPPITGEASANNNVISDNLFIGNAESPPSFLPAGDVVYLQLNPSSEYPEVGDMNCFERNEDPVEFTFFSSDGELPTGGCVPGSSPVPSPDSLAPSIMLDDTTRTPTAMPMPTAEPTSGGLFKAVSIIAKAVALFAFVEHFFESVI